MNDGTLYRYGGASTTTQDRPDEGLNRAIDQKNKVRVVIVIAIMAIITTISILYMIEQDNIPPLVLACELPTERPFMTAPTIWNVSICNQTEARAYAVQFFPECSDCEFENWSDSGGYYVSMENGSLRIEVDGSLFYHIGEWDIETRAPPMDIAFDLALDFLGSHGGADDYSLSQNGNGTVSGDEGEWVYERYFQFHTAFEGYKVLGFDRIDVGVYSYGCDMIRQVHRLDPTDESHQVISSASAWSVICEAEKNSYCLRGERITTVELCYYIDRSTEDVPIVYATWRFSNEDIGLYVNAFTGEIVGGIYP